MKRILSALAVLLGIASMQAQEPAALQHLRKRYNYVGKLSDGLVLIHRGAENAHPSAATEPTASSAMPTRRGK